MRNKNNEPYVNKNNDMEIYKMIVIRITIIGIFHHIIIISQVQLS